jgi:hypothetical protein
MRSDVAAEFSRMSGPRWMTVRLTPDCTGLPGGEAVETSFRLVSEIGRQLVEI